jgi:predicted lipoprotein with Yx(FWY)xxD motif
MAPAPTKYQQPFNAGRPSTVSSANSPVGTILVDAFGRTLYLFDADMADKSSCSNACATVWPPYDPSKPPQAGAGVAAMDLGTVTRADGAMQATYDGHPLYYYVGDVKPGQTNGQGLVQFGAAWYVVGRDGQAITASQPAA